MIHNVKTIKINSLELLKEDQGATQFVWMNTQMNLQGKKTQTLLQKMWGRWQKQVTSVQSLI